MAKSARKLTKKDLTELRERLIMHLKQLQGDVAMMEEDIDSSRKSSGSFSKIPTHPSDIGGDNFEQDFTYERIQAEGDELGDIQKALDKIEAKTDGVCEMCGCNIPKQRLLALPFCRYCIECQEKEESLS